jgi:class 3 adenylate cyclase/tetratricopeptide (TPR) repeat protein
MMMDAATPSERNIISVVAADMVGSTSHITACDPDDAQAFLDRWFDHVRDAVERAGGLIVQYAGDGGVAIFGWPISFEDHAERACIAAWDIQQGLAGSSGPRGSPVLFRVGVHSGLAGVRKVAFNGTSRFDVAGATVHLAAKLQQAACPGEVLISAETAKLCRSSLDLGPQQTSARRVEAIDVHCLKARPHGVNHSHVPRQYGAPIVGRLEEMKLLRERLPRPGGAGYSVAIIGEAGIGKTRLAAAAMAEASAPEVRTLVFRGDAQMRTTPFAAARALIGNLLALHSASADHLQLASRQLNIDANDRTMLEDFLLAAKPDAREQKPNRTQTQLARALVNAFSALAVTQPTLLLAEDLQLIDQESRQFLRLLARAKSPQPLCLLLTGRPESLDEAREIAETIIALQPLPRSQMEELGRQLWQGGGLPACLLSRAIERADGIPFVLEELLRSTDATGTFGLQQLPQSVESVIHARLQQLSPKAKSIAQGLSLLGEEVELDFAAAVLDADMDELLNVLFELERYAFVHPVSGHCTRFRHQIIAESCADTLPRERRQMIHRAAIRVITQRYPSLRGRLPFHAEGAGETEIALGYLWEAGLEARRNSAMASLGLIFDHALKLIERLGDAAEDKYVDFVLMSMPSMWQGGEFKKINYHLGRAMELARRQNRPGQVCGALSQLGLICWFEARYEEGIPLTSEGLEMARALRSPALIYVNQLFLSSLLYAIGHAARAISLLEQLCDMLTGELENARLDQSAMPRAMTLAFMGWFMNSTGQYTEGLDCARRALEIAAREQDPYAEVLARISMGRNLLLLHRNEEAVACMSVALELVDRNGYVSVKANLAGALTTALARTGSPHRAVSLVEACLEEELQLRSGRADVSYLYIGYAEALVRCGNVERGLATVDHAMAIARDIQNPWLVVCCLGLRSRLLAEFAPDAPQISRDLEEQQRICQQFGVVAWPMVHMASEPLKQSA